ncbi:MAG: DnaJ domain-containing protein, partial [Treponema sp.]|nr:DnaJ domain-containing protein [Treponema sp.]
MNNLPPLQRVQKFFIKHHLWLGPLAGGLFGLIGGIPGLFIGIVLGYLTQEVLVQLRQDHGKIDDYENPESSDKQERYHTAGLPNDNFGNSKARGSIPHELSPWELLGIKSDATPEEIKSAYRKLATQFHPDAL